MDVSLNFSTRRLWHIHTYIVLSICCTYIPWSARRTRTPTRTRRSCRVSWASTSGRRSPRASVRANETTPAPWRTRRRPRGRPSGSSRAARGRWTRSVVRCHTSLLNVAEAHGGNGGPGGVLVQARMLGASGKKHSSPRAQRACLGRDGRPSDRRPTQEKAQRTHTCGPRLPRRPATSQQHHKQGQGAASSCHSSPTRSPRAARATCCPR